MVLQQMSQHSQHQSTGRILVPSRPLDLAEQGYNNSSTSYSSNIYGQGGNGWNLLVFGNKSAAIISADTVKCYSIPSIPSRLGAVKTRPD